MKACINALRYLQIRRFFFFLIYFNQRIINERSRGRDQERGGCSQRPRSTPKGGTKKLENAKWPKLELFLHFFTFHQIIINLTHLDIKANLIISFLTSKFATKPAMISMALFPTSLL